MSHFADRKVVGVLFGCASYGLYSLHYATVKWLGMTYSVWQIMFMRSAFMLAITVALGGRGTIPAALASPYKLPTAFRALLQFLSALCFYAAASSMSLSQVTTLYSAAPLIITILSIVVLGEAVRGYRWLALVAGFGGTVIAANPGGQLSPLPTLLALGSALFWALTVVFTRKNGARETSSVQLVTTSIVFMALSAGFMSWRTPATAYEWGLMIFLGVQIYLAQLFFFEACRFAPASLVGPLEYSSVIWACVFGYLVFADIPTLPTIIGALLVAASGIALAVSVTQRAKPAKTVPSEERLAVSSPSD